jgi:PAS domain S-box-containing protein
MADASPVLIWMSGVDKLCNYFNKTWLEFTGRSIEQEMGNGWAEGVHPDDFKKCLNIYINAFDLRQSFSMEYRLKRFNGEYGWVYDQGVPRYTSDGNFIGYIGSCTDITDQKSKEDQITNLLTRYQTLLHTSNDGIHILDINGNLVEANDAFCKMLGYTKEEVLKLNVSDWEANIPKNELIPTIRELIKTPRLFETSHRRKDRTIIQVEINGTGVTLDGASYLYASARDITERKQLESKLIESEKLLLIAQKIGLTGSWIYNPNTNKISASEEGFRMFGINPAARELHIDDIENCIIDRDRVHQALVSLINKGTDYDIEYTVKPADGSAQKIIHSIATLEKDAQGNITKIIGFIQDITERKQMEEKIKQQNKELADVNASKDKFFSIIAHDLRSPFYGFLGLTEIIIQDKDISLEKMRELNSMMNKSADNLFKLLENLLTWARMQRGVIEFRPEYCFLSAILNRNLSVLNQNAKQKNIEIIDQISTDLKALVDLSMLDTIFRNLISNAIKFTPRGGKIIISAEKKEKEILITIKDSGIGMDAKLLDGIFRIDQKTSRPGTDKETSTGLGLLLCKEFIEKHNGKIWVESEEDKGSTFYFMLHDS